MSIRPEPVRPDGESTAPGEYGSSAGLQPSGTDPEASRSPARFEGGQIRILLAEDNEDHAFLTTLALQDAQRDISDQVIVTTVSTGQEALSYLRQEGAFAGAVRPDLTLLDIQLPEMDGIEVLRAMKADESLRTIPVIMLTTSAHERDVLTSYGLGANEYVTKPVNAAEFRSKVQAIPAYWSRVVTRPPRGSENA